MFTEFRQSLPIFRYREQLLKSIRHHQTIIIAGETGCGKTTQIPQYIYEDNPTFRIAVTQPRRVAAMTLADRCSQEKATILGSLIGYNVRFDDRTSKATQITFLTDGMLIRELIVDPKLRKYNVIIIDEAHERTVQSDLLLALLKLLCKSRKDIKLILMSATMQIEKFANYLQTDTIHIIEGRTYPIDVYNTNSRQNDYVESTVNTILQIHLNEPEGDVLAFLTGQDDIEDVKQILEDRLKACNKPLAVKMLYSALPPEVQLEAFQRERTRKVVLSTNIAETSVTIDGIVYVVDCGYVKIRSFQIAKAIDTLLLSPISKAQAEQRAGRAGRQRHGKCFRLYTHETFERLAKFMLPEILRTNLLSVILQMKAIGIKAVLDFDLIDKPSVELMLQNLNQLVRLKALDEDVSQNLKQFNLTEHGRQMSSLPLEPQFSHFLIRAYQSGFAELALSSVAMLEIDNLFLGTNGHAVLNKFKVANSDHLTKAKLLQKYEETLNKKSFCKENHLNQRQLQKAVDIKTQLKEYMSQIQLIETEKQDIEQFKQVLAESLIFKQALYSVEDQAYRLQGSNQLAHIHPESVLFNTKHKAVIYNEVIMTKRVYLRDVTEVEQLYL